MMSRYNRLNLKNKTLIDEVHFKHIEDGIVDLDTRLTNFDNNVQSIAHRGYSDLAPENTLPAFALAKKLGFNYVEADVAFTKDSVPVMIHDDTINRTSNGSGTVGNLNYQDLLAYDFGSWKGAEYAGTKIPTFTEFIRLCKNIGLHPYIEIKHNANYSKEQILQLVSIVKKHGMLGKISWITYKYEYLQYIIEADDTARVGFLFGRSVDTTMNDELINKLVGLKTDKNIVFLPIKNSLVSSAGLQKCMDQDIPVEVWTVDTESEMLALDPYISGVISNKLSYGEVLYENSMKEQYETV